MASGSMDAKAFMPFIGGLVTDVPQWELRDNESPLLQDVIWPKGVPCLRGNWGRTGAVNPFANANALSGVMAVQYPFTPSTVDLFVSDSGGNLGKATGGGAIVDKAGLTIPGGIGERIPRCVYKGELIITSLSGIGAILRHAGQFGTISTVGSGITFNGTAGQSIVTVTGSGSLASQTPVGSFITRPWISGSYAPGTIKVLSVDGNTSLGLSVVHAANITDSVLSATQFASGVGLVGLVTLVTDIGGVSSPGGTGVTPITFTGKATKWLNGAAENGATTPGDLIAFSSASVFANSVSSVSSDISLVTTGGSSTTTDQPHIVARPLPGREACVHQQSLFTAGVPWALRRVFMLPPGADLGALTNQIDATSAVGCAQRFAKWMDVPGPSTSGRVEALLSGGDTGPLLVLATEGAYGVWTTYPPSPTNTTIRLIGPGLGCADLRSAVASEFGQFWAGDDHIATYQNNQCRTLTEGRRGREWRSLMRNRSATAIITAWVVHGHLFIALNDPSGPQSVTWCYDITRQVWCGNITGVNPRYVHSARPVGAPQEAYAVTNETTGQQVAALGSIALDDGAAAGTNQGTLVAETPATLAGDPTTLDRPVDMKVGYEMTGGTGALAVKTSDGTATAGLERTLASGTGFLTERIRPQTDVSTAAPGYLGRQVRQFKVRLEATGSPSLVRVHELAVATRRQRGRA